MLIPSTALTGVLQDRVGSAPTCTVQAPHCAMPQPNFVPVILRCSRITQSKGVSGSASTVTARPLIVKLVIRPSPQGAVISGASDYAQFLVRRLLPHNERRQSRSGDSRSGLRQSRCPNNIGSFILS